CAWWLHELLFIDLGYHNSFSGIVRHVGSFELLTPLPAIQPTLAAYVLYFAALFGIRRWWHMADAFRPRRVRIGALFFTVLIAVLLAAGKPVIPVQRVKSFGLAMALIVPALLVVGLIGVKGASLRHFESVRVSQDDRMVRVEQKRPAGVRSEMRASHSGPDDN